MPLKSVGDRPPTPALRTTDPIACYICGRPHPVSVCPKRGRVAAMAAEDERKEEALLNPLVIAPTSTSSEIRPTLLYIESLVNSRPVTAMIDTGASHLFVGESTAQRMGLKMSPAQDRVRSDSDIDPVIQRISYDVDIAIGSWRGQCHAKVLKLVDYEIIFGLELLVRAKIDVMPYLYGIQIHDERVPCFIPCIGSTMMKKGKKRDSSGEPLSAAPWLQDCAKGSQH